MLLRTLLTPLSWLYAAGWQSYLLVYKLGFKKPAEPHPRVVCIGNLVVGGSGKSPLTLFVARQLQGLGYEVVLSCSGYGSPASEGARLAPEGELDASEWGDEPAMFRLLAPDLPIVVGRRRVLAAELVQKNFPNAVMLMDDGFQHLPLKKHLTIIIEKPSPNRRCLPAGPYREPSSNASRADLVVGDGSAVSSFVLHRLSKVSKTFHTENTEGESARRGEGIDDLRLTIDDCGADGRPVTGDRRPGSELGTRNSELGTGEGEGIFSQSREAAKGRKGSSFVIRQSSFVGDEASGSRLQASGGGEEELGTRNSELGTWEEVQALCALGDPRGFMGSLAGMGLRVVREKSLPDHDPLDAGNLFAGFDPKIPIVVTAKDWVKLRRRGDLGGWDIRVAMLEVSLEPQDEFRAWLADRLNGL